MSPPNPESIARELVARVGAIQSGRPVAPAGPTDGWRRSVTGRIYDSRRTRSGARWGRFGKSWVLPDLQICRVVLVVKHVADRAVLHMGLHPIRMKPIGWGRAGAPHPPTNSHPHLGGWEWDGYGKKTGCLASAIKKIVTGTPLGDGFVRSTT